MLKQKSNSKKILVVEDDKSIASFLEAFLTYQGFEVMMINSGDIALRLLKESSYPHYDLVILDLSMPNVGGYEVVKEIQGTDYQQVPILIMTALQLDRDTIEMLRGERNVQDFFTKPFNPRDMLNRIHKILPP